MSKVLEYKNMNLIHIILALCAGYGIGADVSFFSIPISSELPLLCAANVTESVRSAIHLGLYCSENTS